MNLSHCIVQTLKAVNCPVGQHKNHPPAKSVDIFFCLFFTGDIPGTERLSQTEKTAKQIGCIALKNEMKKHATFISCVRGYLLRHKKHIKA